MAHREGALMMRCHSQRDVRKSLSGEWNFMRDLKEVEDEQVTWESVEITAHD